jgi:hypothetical protein
MYRKLSRFNVARVLSALVLVMILLGGCVPGTPVALPIYTRAPSACKWPTQGEDFEDAAINYISAHYPEQVVPSPGAWRLKASRRTRDQAMEATLLAAGDWLLTHYFGPSSHEIIIANATTGFRWEGQVCFHLDYEHCYHHIDGVIESFVTAKKSGQ